MRTDRARAHAHHPHLHLLFMALSFKLKLPSPQNKDFAIGRESGASVGARARVDRLYRANGAIDEESEREYCSPTNIIGIPTSTTMHIFPRCAVISGRGTLYASAMRVGARLMGKCNARRFPYNPRQRSVELITSVFLSSGAIKMQ